ncbi:MAG: hypothetical protein KY464_15615 [Gemmatimonadetes bacterium]|nr:hypothetical protein [Gemmatimonadota bacterium]
MLTAGDEILLNSAVVRSDVGEFEETLRQGDLERAVSVYQGPFLDGFRVKGAALEFERWADTERERLARSYANALERLAKKCAALGDSAGAVGWWRRLAAHDPYSGSVALGLMMALEAAGDRAGALRHARVYGALLRDDFAADPEPAVVALAARLRKEPAEARIGRETDFGVPSNWSEHPAIEGVVQQERHAEPVSSPEVAPAVETVEFPSTPPPPPSAAAPGHFRAARGGTTLEFRPLTYVLLVLLALTILLALWDGRERKPTTSEGVSPTRIAVFPFAVYGSEEYAYLGEGLVDLLSTKLDGAGELHAVDPHAVLGLTTGGKSLDPDGGRALAHRLGAGLYVLGNVLEAGGQLQLNASLYDAEGRRKTTAQVVVKSEAQVFELIDRLAVQLVAVA